MSDRATVDAYLAALPDDKRRCLQDLRAQLAALLPGSEELMSYGMPGFRLGKMVAGYAAFKTHCGLYPHSGTIIPRLAEEIEAQGLKQSKSGVTFRPDRPPSPGLVARIVALRLEEIGA